MHVVGVPVWEGAKRGLSKKVSKRNVFTPQTLSVILQDKLREEASYGFECYFKEQLAEKKKGRNHDLSVTWRDCWRGWRRWLGKVIKNVQQSVDIDIRRKYHKFMKQEEQMR